MKKLLVLVLLMTMLLPSIGIAEFDLKSMTDEKLLMLNTELAAELFSREKTAYLPIGWYVIGEQIPEGDYIFSLDTSKKTTDSEGREAFIRIYESLETYNYYEGKYSHTYNIRTRPDPESKIILESGNVLSIAFADVFIKKAAFIIEFK